MSNSNSFTRNLSLCKQSLKSRLPQIATILLAALVTTSSLAGPGDKDPGKKSTAQRGGAGGGNGGDADEINFKIKLQKIVRFLSSPEGQKAFPEINPREFSESVDRVTVKISDTEVKDNFGNTRTCAWDRQAWKISCNRARLNLAGVSPEVQFTLIMHEMLGLMGLEEGNQEDPSLYTYSSRLIPYVKQVIDYDLNYGKKRASFLEMGISCREKRDPESRLGLKKSYVATASSSGEVTLWKVSEPTNYSFYFNQQCSTAEGLPCKDFARKQRTMKWLGLVPKAKLIASGRIDTSSSYKSQFVVLTTPDTKKELLLSFGTSVVLPTSAVSTYAGSLTKAHRDSDGNPVFGKSIASLSCFIGGLEIVDEALKMGNERNASRK